MTDMIPGGYCRDCKWWNRDHEDTFGMDESLGVCGLAESNGNKPASHPESNMRAYDAERYHAGLSTKADFGCVQWKRKSE